jgi:hypothetical protein
MSEKQSNNSNRGGARQGAGRPKGSLDKGNALIRDMVAQALDELGGAAYFVEVGRSHPAALMALIGKTMPIQVEGAGGGPVQHIARIELVPMRGRSSD